MARSPDPAAASSSCGHSGRWAASGALPWSLQRAESGVCERVSRYLRCTRRSAGILSVMFEVTAPVTQSGIIAKTGRRVALALAIGVGAGLLLLHGWTSSTFSLFVRTVAVAL